MNTHSQQHPRVAPDKIRPDDPRYADLVRRGYNKRFAGKPDYVRLVGSTEQVVDAVQDAVRDNLRVAGLYYDPEMAAFAVEPGAFINHPDVDLADPEWNTSGVPWHTPYPSALRQPAWIPRRGRVR